MSKNRYTYSSINNDTEELILNNTINLQKQTKIYTIFLIINIIISLIMFSCMILLIEKLFKIGEIKVFLLKILSELCLSENVLMVVPQICQTNSTYF